MWNPKTVHMVKKKCTTINAESYPFPETMGISLTHLVSLSTTVNTLLNNPLSSRSVMKSMDHTKKHSARVSTSYNKPAGAEVKSCCWQTWHPRTIQRPHMTSLATKHSEAEKIKSCGYPSACQVCNASHATKASKADHQVESLEAPKRDELGGDNTPVGHCGPCIRQKYGHRPQHE